jgi:hypothetical protein
MYGLLPEFTKDPLKEAFAKYMEGLERAALGFDKERSRSARDSVVQTVRFLANVGAPGHLITPLMEAAELAMPKLHQNSLSLARGERVFQAVAVKFQIQCGLTEDRACRKVLGSNQAEAINKLKNFITALTRKSNPYPRERDLYFRLLAEYRGLRGKVHDFDGNMGEAEIFAAMSLRTCKAFMARKK